MDNNLVDIISEENLADKIYTIRGQKVMLDFELAETYGYEINNLMNELREIKKNVMVRALCMFLIVMFFDKPKILQTMVLLINNDTAKPLTLIKHKGFVY